MIIKKEFILNEDDIKYAIRDYLAYDVDDTDKLSVDLKVEQTQGVVGFVVSAVCTEKTEDA